MKRLALVLLVACKKEPLAQPVEAGAPDAGSPIPTLVSVVDGGADPCKGALVDLPRALRDPACQARFEDRPPLGTYDKLALRVTPEKAKVAPGGHIDFDVAIVNTSDQPVPLLFATEPLGFSLGVLDAHERSTATPSGDCPGMEVREPPMTWAKIVLAPRGEARARFGWDATKLRYQKRVREPRGICDVVPDGPLARGAYKALISIQIWTQHAEGAKHPDWAQGWLERPRFFDVAVE